jgi:hypothetical protein
MEFSAGLADICQQPEHSSFRNASHAGRCANRIALNQGRNYTNILLEWQVIHGHHYA